MRLQAAAEQLLQMAACLKNDRHMMKSLVSTAQSTAAKRHAPAISTRSQEQLVCRLLNSGRFEQAAKEYNPTLTLPKTSYTQFIDYYLDRGQLSRADRLYQHMRFTGCRPSLETFSRLITAHCQPDSVAGGIADIVGALRYYRDLRTDCVNPDSRVFRPLVFSNLSEKNWRSAMELSEEWLRNDKDGWIEAADEIMDCLLDLVVSNLAPIDPCLMLFHSAQSSLISSTSDSHDRRRGRLFSDRNWNRLLWRLLLKEKRIREAWLVQQQMRLLGVRLGVPRE